MTETNRDGMTRPDETMEGPKHRIGDTVWFVYASCHVQIEVPCPVCYGKKRVTMILGNDERVSVACEGCGIGCDGPRGVVKRYCKMARVESAVITGLSVRDGEWRYETDRYRQGDSHLFTSREDAEAHRESVLPELDRLEQSRWERNALSRRKKHGWTVRYCMSEIRKLEDSLRRYRERLVVLKSEKEQAK